MAEPVLPAVTWVSVKDAGVCAHKNKRRKMEDCHTLVDKLDGIDTQAWFGVYDGHGGVTAAKFCETRLHTAFVELAKDLPEEDDWTHSDKVHDIFSKAFKKTDQEMKESVPAAGACVVTALVRKVKDARYLYISNLGDARAVLSRGGKAVRLSYDHKPTLDEEKKRIEDVGGFVDSQGRVNGLVAVSRAMGDHNMKGENKSYISNDPYFSLVKLEEEADFLILACDGVWDVVEDQAAIDLIRDGAASCKERAKKLLLHAIKTGTEDNVSVIVVQL